MRCTTRRAGTGAATGSGMRVDDMPLDKRGVDGIALAAHYPGMDHRVHKAGIVRDLKTLGTGFVAGVASLTSFAHSAPVPHYPHRSSTEALRSDWNRIVSDMKIVFERENARIEKTKK